LKGLNPHFVSRRHFLASTTLAGAGLLLAPPRLAAADEESIVVRARRSAANAKITVQQVRGNISVLLGSGGNIAVLTGDDGKLLVDAGFAGSRPAISDALAQISSDPVKHLVNTHWHFDHTDGNEWLHSVGAAITAHENTRKRMSVSTRVEAWKYTFPPAPDGALPQTVFKTDRTVHLNGMTVELKYYGPSHTDTDLSAMFVEADVLHCGDTWWNGFYPFIDYSTGGNINGMIAAAEANVSRVTEQSIIIPGHGKVGNKAELTGFRDMLVGVRDHVAALKKQGKSLDETIAARPTADYDPKWARSPNDGKTFVGLVYAGV